MQAVASVEPSSGAVLDLCHRRTAAAQEHRHGTGGGKVDTEGLSTFVELERDGNGETPAARRPVVDGPVDGPVGVGDGAARGLVVLPIRRRCERNRVVALVVVIPADL